MDPIAELVEALDADGKPPLAWVLRWEEPGGDPVANAWRESEDAVAMASLIGRSRMSPYAVEIDDEMGAVADTAKQFFSEVITGKRCDSWTLRIRFNVAYATVYARLVRELREHVPPTLAECIDAARKRGENG